MREPSNDLWTGGPREQPSPSFPTPPAVVIPSRRAPLLRPKRRWKRRRRPLFPFLTLFVLVVSLTVGAVAVRYLWPQESETDPGIIATSSQQDPFAALERAETGTGVTVTISPAPEETLTATEIYQKCVPSIVSLWAEGDGTSSTGTGIVMSADGYLLTNAHVVANSLRVYAAFHDDTILEAKLVGADADADVAVLKVDAHGLSPAEFGDSDQLLCGDMVVAIGDPLGYRASWESLVNFRDEEATRRTETISAEAQWFEDHSPIDPKYRKEKVKGVSAKVITATMLDAMGVSPLLSGGAILAGVFMGDRCSPVSTSAALVAVVTKTNLYTNLKLMVKTSVVPLLAACAVYAAIGLLNPGRDAGIDVTGIFRSAFSLHWTTYLPAVVLLALIFLKFSIRLTMVASTLAAVLLCAFVQDMPWRTIGETLVLGFAPEDPGVAKMLAGGGLVSMLPVCAIILISSTYSGLLEGTGLIARLKGLLPGVARRLTPFGAVLTTAVVTCGIACNQALPVMLTNQLCDQVRPDRQKMAIDLENTVIVIAPLIPWSIAGAVPIASVGAPAACVLAAFYLWFLPLWQWILAFVERARQTRGA